VDVVDATSKGKLDQALAVVADFESQAAKVVASKLVNAPLTGEDRS
jgi:hypothetical protein